MQREVIDLKTVYYRGRFRASTAWSRIGKASAAEKTPVPEGGAVRGDRLTKRYPKTSPSYRPVS